MEYLKKADEDTYNHIISKYDNNQYGNEACSYLIEKIVREFGSMYFMASTFEGSNDLVSFAKIVQTYLKDGNGKETSNQHRQIEADEETSLRGSYNRRGRVGEEGRGQEGTFREEVGRSENGADNASGFDDTKLRSEGHLYDEQSINAALYSDHSTRRFMNTLKELKSQESGTSGGRPMLEQNTVTMKMDVMAIAKRTMFATQFAKAALTYKCSLEGMMRLSTEGAKAQIQELINDLYAAVDYYNRLAKGEDVWRTGDTKFRRESPIENLMRRLEQLNELKEQMDAEKNAAVKEMREFFGNTEIVVVNSMEEAKALGGKAYQALKKGENIWGWFKDGKVYVFMPNNMNAEDVRTTILHEIAGHKGL